MTFWGLSNYSNETVANFRNAFIAGNKLSESSIRPDIFNSWTRSKIKGVDPHIKFLSGERAEEMANTINRCQYYEDMRAITSKYLIPLYDLVSSSKAVVMGTDLNMLVINMHGDQHLIEELNSINLGIGSKLNESIAGTNAAALAMINETDSFVVGAEHYIDALQNYACSAIPLRNGFSKIIGSYMVFSRLQDYTPLQQGLLHYFGNTFSNSLSAYIKDMELTLTQQIIEGDFELKDAASILVGSRGGILRLNQQFTKLFNLKSDKIVGKSIVQVPELEDIWKNIKLNDELTEVCIDSGGKSEHYFCQIKPIYRDKELIGKAINLRNSKQLRKRITHLYATFTFDNLLGKDPEFLKTKEFAQNTSQNTNSTTILIQGESGTGKELFAQAIHNASSRSEEPFVSLNCAALPRELIGSELFGYVEGAFTGARKGGAVGKFELADKGTLFLDEIGDMPIDMQAILLRVLEERMITRLGSNKPVEIDVRLIAATNKDLWHLVNQGKFRPDLYYRLNVISLQIPPLRKRRGDIQILLQFFISEFSSIYNKNVDSVSPQALEVLLEYDWPGNCRQLKNVVESAIVRTNQKELTEESFVLDYSENKMESISSSYKNDISRYERQYILDMLEVHNGNKAKVAKELGITRATLYKKLKG